MSTVDAIKERLDIVDVIGGYVQLHKAGRNFKANCPFHQERTPSFVVFPESQRWRCFGACNEGGDLFTFVMKREGWDFAEALQRLAERAGVELEPRTPARAAEEEQHERLRAALVAAATYYHHLLVKAPAGAHARAYVQQRGLRAETLERFQIGYAPESWDTARTYLTGQGFTLDELVQAGVLTRNPDSGSVYDRFRERLMIPIRDTQGRVIGFGGRAFGDGQPKYLNSPQSPLFDKSAVLFALDLGRKALRETGVAVIVEGYMDAIAAHQAGFANVVAQMGTALTEQQLKTLKRYARRFVLALDADAAGVSATLRGLQVARETLDREGEAVFDPHGLLRFEGRLQADIRVLTLPAGQDPDEVIRADAADWQRRVDTAQPIVEYVLGVVTAGRDLDDPKVKADVARQMLPLVGDVANPIERDGYVQKLARLLRVDEHAMRAQVTGSGSRRSGSRQSAAASRGMPEISAAQEVGDFPAPGARRPGAGPTPGTRLPAAGPARLEAYCLGLLLQAPHLLAAADQMLVGAGLDVLTADDFDHPEYRQIFHAVRHAARELGEPLVWEERLPAVLHARLAQLLAATAPEDEEDQRTDWLDAAFRLRDQQLNARGRQLQLLVQEARETYEKLLREWQAHPHEQALQAQVQEARDTYENLTAANREHARAMDYLYRLGKKRTRYATGRESRRTNFLL